MSDIVRIILSATLGWRWVVLIDHDGERNIRRVRFMGGRAFASRLSLGIRDVWLCDNGTLQGGSWVERWEPYNPSAKRQWPKYESGAA